MGLSYLSDAVTGQAFAQGEDVVAIVIQRKSGGYPDAVKHAAMPGIHPDHLFQQISLPIRGKAGSYGDIEVDDRQTSARLACALTGAPDWKTFSDTALDWQVGAAIIEKGPLAVKREAEALGIMVMGAATWRAMLEINPDAAPMKPQVELMRDILLDLWSRPLVGDAWRNLGVAELKARGDYTFGDGRVVHLPDIASALSDGIAGPVGEDLRRQLTDRAGPLGIGGWDHPESRNPKALTEILERIWETTVLRRGLGALNRYVLPSGSGGQYQNQFEVATIARNTFEQAVEAIIVHAIDMDAEDVDDAERLLAQLDEARARIADRVAEAKDQIAQRAYAP